MTADEKNQVLFMNLVMMFHTLAWQGLGKIKSPVNGAIERNLESARNFIDTLEMLKVKSTGNLKEDETRFLDEVLKELRLNYVDECAKEAQEGPPPKPQEAEADGQSS